MDKYIPIHLLYYCVLNGLIKTTINQNNEMEIIL